MAFNDTDHEITKIDVLKEQKIGEAFDAVAAASLFGIDWTNTAELTLTLFGGAFYDGSAIVELDVWTDDLAPSATNYVEATRAGVVSVNQVGFTAGRIELYEIGTTADGISSWEDKRAFFIQGGNARFGALAATSLALAGGTLTDSAPALTITQTWNDATEVFVGADMNITDNASDAASIMQRWRVAGSAMVTIFKTGAMLLAGVLGLAAGAVGTVSLYMGGDTSSGIYRSAANQVGIAISGTQRINVASGGLTVTGGLGIGSGANVNNAFTIVGTGGTSTAATQRGMNNAFSPTASALTAIHGHRIAITLADAGGAAYALVNDFMADVLIRTNGADTLTERNGFVMESATIGTSIYGFRGKLTVSGVARWNAYMSGTAPNHFNGEVMLGTTTSGGGNAILTFADAKDIAFNTATGTKIGTATTQKIGLWNKQPVVQPSTSVTAATRTGGGGAALTDTDTWDGYTVGRVVGCLRVCGILA